MARLGTSGRSVRMELLGRIPLFSTCSQRELAQVATLTVPAQLKAGTVLTRQGHSGGIAYVLVSGTAEVLRGGRKMTTLRSGDVVGELSLLDGEPRSATVRAVTDIDVLELDSRDLRRLLKKAPPVQRKLLQALAGRLRDVDTIVTAST